MLCGGEQNLIAVIQVIGDNGLPVMENKTKPNVILINCDDLGYGDLGCYGSPVNNTPTIDKIATENMRFTDFYITSSVCSPSRSAMLTGCYPKRIGFSSFENRWVLFPGQPLGLSENEVTIADILQNQGYATKLVGKWHCGDQREFLPTRHGFDSYYGLPYSNDMGIQSNREHLRYPPLPLLADEEVVEQQPDQTSLTERYVEQAVRFIRENKSRNFFLYFAHMYVHLPLYTSSIFLKNSKNGAYGAAVSCIDWATDVILSEVKNLGLDEDTLILFTSDNGSRGDHGGSNAPLRGRKGTTWEGGMRVPCIMRWPGTIPAGQVNSELVTSMDFLPTLSGLAGGSAPSDRPIDGHDIGEMIIQPEKHRSSYDAFFYYNTDDLEAVRSGKWKLHTQRKKESVAELYDLESDIGETENHYNDYPDVVSDLEKKLAACRLDLGDGVQEGSACREVGRVKDPVPLTRYDPDHPYIIALYDIEDAG